MPQGLALSLIIVILISAAIATIVLALRLYIRGWVGRRGKVWGWEDTFAVLGYVRLSPVMSWTTAMKLAVARIKTAGLIRRPISCLRYPPPL